MVRQNKSSGSFYYDFIRKGKRYSGVCTGCKTRRDAEFFEKRMKEQATSVSPEEKTSAEQESFHKAALRRIQQKKNRIPLAGAFELSLGEAHRRAASEKTISEKREMWLDFVAFMGDKHPDVTDLGSVTESMAEEYLVILRSEGRYRKTVTYRRNGKSVTRPAVCKPSNRTTNHYHDTCKEVFALLSKDAGVHENPFDSIDRLSKDAEIRDIFTDDELRIIHEKVDPFLHTLFFVAENTGLREGDICTLQWDDIHFLPNGTGYIRRIMNKTGKVVEIPLMPELYAFLADKFNEEERNLTYCFPEHAEMYLSNPSGVSYRIKDFLETDCGIKTTRIPKGRTHAVSVKDLHSMRHTFAHKLEQAGVPLTVIQQLVGHSSAAMTMHYSGHNTIEEKTAALSKLASSVPDYVDVEAVETVPKRLACGEPERAKLHELIDTLPIEKVREMLELCKKTDRET